MDRKRNDPRRRSRSKSSGRWLARQRKDPFVKKASQTGKASRAHFKLEQLDARFRLLRPGQRVLELGAAPGGWTGYIEEKIRPGGKLIVCDDRPVAAAGDTVVVKGLAGEASTDAAIDAAVSAAVAADAGASGLDLVLSDMAPNISGIRAADQARSMELVGIAEAAADRWLKPGGAFVVKVFQGDGIEDWIRQMRMKFDKFKLVKPAASRPDSREMYAVAQRLRRA